MPKKRSATPAEKGIKCPRCESPDIKVYYGRLGENCYYRQRECRDCGHQFMTCESVLGSLPAK